MAVYNTKPDFDQSNHTWGTDSEQMITDLCLTREIQTRTRPGVQTQNIKILYLVIQSKNMHVTYL
jgi:hypothetical protein